MSRVQLVRLDPALEEGLSRDPAYLEGLVESNWERVADRVHSLIGRTLSQMPVSVDALAWGGYFVIDAQSREVVGSCAFKAPPTPDGSVEIAYFTYPQFVGRGYATATAERLVEMAGRSHQVRQVIAHTLPQSNASTRVLQKAGFVLLGEVNDPEDGKVWRWNLPTGLPREPGQDTRD